MAMVQTRLLQRIGLCLQQRRNNHFHSRRIGKRPKTIPGKDDIIMVSGEILYGYYPVLMALKAGKRKFHALYYNDEGKDKILNLAEMAREKG